MGSVIAAAGFFFFPLVELRPNVVASGIGFNLFELQDDARYVLLFGLALVPLVVAFREDRLTRGWILALLGALMMTLTLWLPTLEGVNLIENAAQYLEEGQPVTNPRLLPSIGIALGVFGGFIVSFSGVIDLQAAGTSRLVIFIAGSLGFVGIYFLFRNGSLDTYSLLQEYYTRGTTLNIRFIEHTIFVTVSLLVGTILGIALGLWASRSKAVAPVILYAVGIIQTVPSLALFGILLVPLAQLGDQSFESTLLIFAVTGVVSAFQIGLLVFIGNRFGRIFNFILLISTTLVATIPLSLFVIVLVSFLFEIISKLLIEDEYAGQATLVGAIFLFTFIAWIVRRRGIAFTRFSLVGSVLDLFTGLTGRLSGNEPTDKRLEPVNYERRLAYDLILGTVIAVVFGLALFFDATNDFFANESSISTIELRDLGVKGIGVTPALIALTLYSLLPLVRNTYAGLNNVDPAIIDSGKGMGMTPRQIFFSIELPLAFPIIMAGVRNAGVALVGIGAVASAIGAGGLGDFIFRGIVNTSLDNILLGTIPAILFAFGLDFGLRAIELLLTSPGIRQAGQ